MKIAICYYSRHHGNTLKVMEAMCQKYPADFIDVTNPSTTCLDEYELIGFASGIYGFDFHKMVADFARQYLPRGKKVFFVYTYGLNKGIGCKTLAQIASQKDAVILGEYGCKGYDTFGPLKLTGGISKGHPDSEDLLNAQKFYQDILDR
ncbi:MAG: flavodoxin domain-containing protein [Candidatus Merdivicinus sp.]|jgi:flavodoxin